MGELSKTDEKLIEDMEQAAGDVESAYYDTPEMPDEPEPDPVEALFRVQPRRVTPAEVRAERIAEALQRYLPLEGKARNRAVSMWNKAGAYKYDEADEAAMRAVHDAIRNEGHEEAERAVVGAVYSYAGNLPMLRKLRTLLKVDGCYPPHSCIIYGGGGVWDDRYITPSELADLPDPKHEAERVSQLETTSGEVTIQYSHGKTIVSDDFSPATRAGKIADSMRGAARWL
jgi:hypothetical protein